MSHVLIDCRTYRVSVSKSFARRLQDHRSQAHSARVVCQQSASEVVVVGAGAAGLTAAYFAASQGAQVLMSHIEHPLTVLEGCTLYSSLHTSFARSSAVEQVVLAQVTVLEKNKEAGKKVLISGGTRWYVCMLALAVAAEQPPISGCIDAAMYYQHTQTSTRTTSQSPSLEH